MWATRSQNWSHIWHSHVKTWVWVCIHNTIMFYLSAIFFDTRLPRFASRHDYWRHIAITWHRDTKEARASVERHLVSHRRRIIMSVATTLQHPHRGLTSLSPNQSVHVCIKKRELEMMVGGIVPLPPELTINRMWLLWTLSNMKEKWRLSRTYVLPQISQDWLKWVVNLKQAKIHILWYSSIPF